MERFDDIVCDPRLRRDALLAHLDGLDHDAPYLGRYRVMTHQRLVRPQGPVRLRPRRLGRRSCAQFLRYSAMTGMRAAAARGCGSPSLGGGAPTHMSRRGRATLAIGLHRMLALPRDAAARRARRRRSTRSSPTCCTPTPRSPPCWPRSSSAGRLRIAPRAIIDQQRAAARPRWPSASRRRSACGRSTSTRRPRACGARECERARRASTCSRTLRSSRTSTRTAGPCPTASPARALLVTNLFNRVQPLIRFEVSDVVTLDAEPCPCGRTLRAHPRDRRPRRRRAALPGTASAVAVHPLQFARRHRRPRRARVPGRPARRPPPAARRLRDDAAAPRWRAAPQPRRRALLALGVADPHIEVEPCRAIERPAAASSSSSWPSPRPRSWPRPAPASGDNALMPVAARPMMSFWICEVPS